MFIKQSDLPAVMNRPEGSLTEQPAAVQENRRTLGKGKIGDNTFKVGSLKQVHKANKIYCLSLILFIVSKLNLKNPSCGLFFSDLTKPLGFT